MSIQPYSDPSQALALYQAEKLTPEEIERRKQEAEELDKKLRHIVENVPDRIYHVMGSNAAAGSGEFHTYRHSRRREQERLKAMEEEAVKEEKEKERMRKLAELGQHDEEKTAKRRAQRQKKKEKQRSKRFKGDGQEGARGQANDLPPNEPSPPPDNDSHDIRVEQSELD